MCHFKSRSSHLQNKFLFSVLHFQLNFWCAPCKTLHWAMKQYVFQMWLFIVINIKIGGAIWFYGIIERIWKGCKKGFIVNIEGQNWYKNVKTKNQIAPPDWIAIVINPCSTSNLPPPLLPCFGTDHGLIATQLRHWTLRKCYQSLLYRISPSPILRYPCLEQGNLPLFAISPAGVFSNSNLTNSHHLWHVSYQLSSSPLCATLALGNSPTLSTTIHPPPNPYVHMLILNFWLKLRGGGKWHDVTQLSKLRFMAGKFGKLPASIFDDYHPGPAQNNYVVMVIKALQWFEMVIAASTYLESLKIFSFCCKQQGCHVFAKTNKLFDRLLNSKTNLFKKSPWLPFFWWVDASSRTVIDNEDKVD